MSSPTSLNSLQVRLRGSSRIRSAQFVVFIVFELGGQYKRLAAARRLTRTGRRTTTRSRRRLDEYSLVCYLACCLLLASTCNTGQRLRERETARLSTRFRVVRCCKLSLSELARDLLGFENGQMKSATSLSYQVHVSSER